MYDVYLGGTTTHEWRKEFKEQISSDISIYDPYRDDVSRWTARDKSEQIAKELCAMEECHIVVFYFNSKISKSARLNLGDAVGSNKQVIVCLDGKVPGKTFIERYCEFRGVMVVKSLVELVGTVEEYASQLEICSSVLV